MTHSLPKGSPRRVVIYCRISDDREGRRWGVERQEKVCRERAERNGWEIVEVLIENDISAYSGKPRPKYQQLLDMLRSGEADAVLALSVKRLQRNWRDAFEFLDLAEKRDIAIDTIKAGRYNLNTAEGRAQARRAAIDAQEESEEIGERVRDAKADNLREGTYRGGPRPFGYEADGTTVRTLACPRCPAPDGFTADRECRACGAEAFNEPGSEAWHAEQATDAVIAGDSLRSICRSLKAQGVRTVPRRYKQPDGTRGEPEDRDWEPTELRKMLLRPRNAGLIEHKGEIVGRAQWPALVPEEKWRACKAVLERPERRTTTSNARVWIGTGLYRCYCGEFARGSTSGTGGREKAERAAAKVRAAAAPDGAKDGQGRVKTWAAKYRCYTGKHVVRDATALDEYVISRAIARLSRPDAAELVLPPAKTEEDREDLEATANALRAKLDSFAADYAADLITRQQMLDGTLLTRKRLEKIEQKMAARAARSVLASLPLGTPKVAKVWPTFHLDKQRAILDAIMTVTIQKARRGRPPGFKPGNGDNYFDESTITIEWKKPDGGEQEEKSPAG
ncbi:recombinase family protein [Streptomyces sp. ME19-01-6]|uniref:recombinase family protein n=1 Tax=Streptomyces sp. ME19-01-6 TaxID=3028686 RepID=UPI0029A020B9|nr:recombinase family protein [Streptomyces sp. ME19-01-6]MDX3229423.1 recombinase family protein [Streptomyces sp. ME19-01-6]